MIAMGDGEREAPIEEALMKRAVRNTNTPRLSCPMELRMYTYVYYTGYHCSGGKLCSEHRALMSILPGAGGGRRREE